MGLSVGQAPLNRFDVVRDRKRQAQVFRRFLLKNMSAKRCGVAFCSKTCPQKGVARLSA
jgi:hypothetical protein